MVAVKHTSCACIQTVCILALMTLPSARLVADEVTLYNWEAYLAESVIEQFTQATGHTVKQVFFEDEHKIETLFSTGQANVFDLIILENNTAHLLGKHGYLRPINTLGLTQLKHIDQRWLTACGDHSIPYSWGTVGVAYRSSLIDKPVLSWMDFFQPSSSINKPLVVHKDARSLTGAALLALAEDPNTEDVAALEQAYHLLTQQRPFVEEYKYGVAYAIEHGSSSQMAMTLAYSADLEEIISQTKQEDWLFVIPQEGSMLWADCLGLPSRRPLKTATIEFLDFINRPDIAAMNAQQAWISTPNTAAFEQLPSRTQQDPELYPSAAIRNKSHPFKTLSQPTYTLRLRMMNQLTLDASKE